ncbi:MAG TPA: hypothetical protein ENJ95_02085 [Bacteroidetes bacterium]|nr:hypothetical protein [Bacteroidota bacterium]
MKHIILSLALLIGVFGRAGAQTSKQFLKAANEEFADKNYYGAMKHYQEAMDRSDDDVTEILFKYAESARLLAAYTFADSAYTKITVADTTGKYPMALYWLAAVKKKQGDYLGSQQLFQLFADQYALEFPEYASRAKEEIEALNWAIEEITLIDEDVVVEQLDETVNSPYSETSPVQMGDYIYFSTQNYFREINKKLPKRMFSKVVKSEIGSGETQFVEWNDSLRHTANAVFTDSLDRVYYTLCDYVGESAEVRCQLYFRNINKVNGALSVPAMLPPSINRPGFTVTDPCLGFDEATGETWLYFVSDRSGGKGGLDIWASVVQENGHFSEPFNLTAINTPGDEAMPMFHSPSQTLYFSSNGKQGFGGFDIYSVLRKDGKWVDETHLPVPYNSSYDDTNFWVNKGRTQGYFASNRLGSHVLEPEFEACCYDLYKFTVQVIDLDVLTFNKKNKEALKGVTVELYELTPTGELKLAGSTNDEGNDFDFELKKDTKYVLLATRDGFLPLRHEIDMSLPENTADRTLKRELYLVPEQVDLNVFSFNKKTMRPLKAVEVRLVIDGQEVDFKKNEEGNDVSFVLDRGKKYQLIGAKVAYFPDTIMIDLTTDVDVTELKKELLLQPKEIEDFPPLVIYFDNDQPDPKTRKTTTELTYEETWRPYMDKADLYVSEYVKSLSGFDSLTSARRMRAFFEREVNNGFLSLEVFTENILEIMDDGGFKVELIIQGFTSPRASADYNYKLSQRRSDCLKNHFERWRGGILKKYVDEGRITLEVVGYGEELAPQFISDKLDDERGSIYSVQASFERKVAIIGARRVAEN